MIDVIGTDAGAPASLPEALQALMRQADLIAAPQRMQPALKQWLEGHGSTRCINSDDPISLCKSLIDLNSNQRGVVLASGGLSLPKIASDLAYRTARELGMSVVAPSPALVPLGPVFFGFLGAGPGARPGGGARRARRGRRARRAAARAGSTAAGRRRRTTLDARRFFVLFSVS